MTVPIISKVIKENLSAISKISTVNISLIAFVILNVLTGFIASSTFFISSGIQKHFRQFEAIILTDYEAYLHAVFIIAFVAVILCIFGCHCADIKSPAATTAYLVLTSITFIGYLLYILYLMIFIEAVPEKIEENYKNASEFEIKDVEGWLGCVGEECKEFIASMVRKNLHNLVMISCIVIGCQLLCKFIGTKFLSDMEKEQRAIRISYIMEDFESPKQTFMINQKV